MKGASLRLGSLGIAVATLSLIGASSAAWSRTQQGGAPPGPSGSRTGAQRADVSDEDLGAIRQGRLENGLRYVVAQRTGKEPGFAIYMRVMGGFLAERRPEERGLVHLVEHIAFKGSTHLEPGALQRTGLPLTLPAPSAASTNWGNTSYYLTARNGDERSLDTLMMLFREIGSELTFPDAGVREARAEVLKEMADKSAGNRTYADYIRAVAPGTPNDLIEAQNSDAVPVADVRQLRELYHRLYRPDRTSIVVVGAVDGALAEALIKKRFGDWKAAPVRSGPQAVPPVDLKRIRPISVSADPAGRSVVTVSVTMPPASYEAEQKQRFEDGIMDAAMANGATTRLRSAQPSAPDGKTGVMIENGDGYRLIRTWDFSQPERWSPALVDLRRQMCGLYRTGWSKDEWSGAKAATLLQLRAEAERRKAQKNVDVAAEIADAGADARRVVPAEALARVASEWLPRVTASQANLRWRRAWGGGVEHTRVESPALAGVASPLKDVAEAVEASGGARCER